jgi:antitoxin HicB
MNEEIQEANIHTGSTFDDFLEEEGIRNEVESAAIKRVLAWQFEQEMEKQQKTKQGMARELKTSRSQLDRLLDPANTAVSLETLTRAASVLGKRLVFEIRDFEPLKMAVRGSEIKVVGTTVTKRAKVVGRGLQGRGRGPNKDTIRVPKGVSGR